MNVDSDNYAVLSDTKAPLLSIDNEMFGRDLISKGVKDDPNDNIPTKSSPSTDFSVYEPHHYVNPVFQASSNISTLTSAIKGTLYIPQDYFNIYNRYLWRAD